MLCNKSQKFKHRLMLVVMSCLCSCTTTNYNSCPFYPIAGQKVAQELEQISTDDYPHTWEWLGRINKLRQELEICTSIENSN